MSDGATLIFMMSSLAKHLEVAPSIAWSADSKSRWLCESCSTSEYSSSVHLVAECATAPVCPERVSDYNLLPFWRAFVSYAFFSPDQTDIKHRQCLSNLRFFLANAGSNGYDLAISVIGSSPWPPPGLPAAELALLYQSHVHVTRRSNLGVDVYAHTAALDEAPLALYSHFVFLNCGTRGPYSLPNCGVRSRDGSQKWDRKLLNASDWLRPFAARLTHEVPIVGSTISCEHSLHVQSHFLCASASALKHIRAAWRPAAAPTLGAASDGHRAPDDSHRAVDAAISAVEVGLSTTLLRVGFALGSMQAGVPVAGLRRCPKNWPAVNPSTLAQDPFQLVFLKHGGHLHTEGFKGSGINHPAKFAMAHAAEAWVGMAPSALLVHRLTPQLRGAEFAQHLASRTLWHSHPWRVSLGKSCHETLRLSGACSSQFAAPHEKPCGGCAPKGCDHACGGAGRCAHPFSTDRGVCCVCEPRSKRHPPPPPIRRRSRFSHAPSQQPQQRQLVQEPAPRPKRNLSQSPTPQPQRQLMQVLQEVPLPPPPSAPTASAPLPTQVCDACARHWHAGYEELGRYVPRKRAAASLELAGRSSSAARWMWGTKAQWDAWGSSASSKLADRDAAEMVVSHCTISLRNLPDVISALQAQAGVRVDAVHIYSKCGVPVEKLQLRRKLPQVRIYATALSNYGRNDHTYAYHIAHFAVGTRTPLLLFMKDTNIANITQRNSDGTIARVDSPVSIPLMARRARRRGFACGRRPAPGWSNWHLESWFWGFALEYHKPAHEQHSIANDKWHQLAVPHERRTSTAVLGAAIEAAPFASSLRPLGAWLRGSGIFSPELVARLTGSWTPLVPVCYGGAFAVRRDRLMAVPNRTWVQAEQALRRGDNIEEGHFFERLWAALLMAPTLTTAQAVAVVCSARAIRPGGSPESGGLLDCQCSKECSSPLLCSLPYIA